MYLLPGEGVLVRTVDGDAVLGGLYTRELLGFLLGSIHGRFAFFKSFS